MAERSALTDAEIDAAIRGLSDPERLEAATQLVAARAPQLQGILDQALHAAGWFDQAHESSVLSAAGKPDADERLRAVRTLIVEETRVSMMIGVAVGYELANALLNPESEETD